MKKFIYTLVSFLIAQNVIANSPVDSIITEFNVAVKVVEQKVAKYGAENVLVVLDIDNTLLTSDIDLGGDIWYQWQREKLAVKPTEKQKINDCFYEDAIGLLYQLGTMHLIDTLVPAYVESWQNSEITTFALTSRSPSYRQATERELRKNNFDFTKNPLKIEGELIYNVDYNKYQSISYINGVMMTTGLNKGEMLAYILAQSPKKFKAIVFVDDSEKNVINLKEKYQTVKNIDFSILHYQKVEEDRKQANNGVVITKKQALKMNKDWNKTNRVLNHIFKGRYKDGDCMN